RAGEPGAGPSARDRLGGGATASSPGAGRQRRSRSSARGRSRRQAARPRPAARRRRAHSDRARLPSPAPREPAAPRQYPALARGRPPATTTRLSTRSPTPTAIASNVRKLAPPLLYGPPPGAG